MFHSIKLLKQEVTAAGRLRITYQIEDTCFKQSVELIGPNNAPEAYYEPVAIHQVYTNRSLNVVRNLAIYYLTLSHGENYVQEDVGFIDKYFPQFNYGKKYAKIVKMNFLDFKQIIDEYNRDEQELLKKLKTP